MQGNPPWFTPTASALQQQQTDNSNYFYNYNRQSWERSVNGYQSERYSGPGQYPMCSTMRTCSESQGFGHENSQYQCPPMYFRQEMMHGDNSANHHVRPRLDRAQAGNLNGNIPSCGPPTPSNNKMRHPRSAVRPNDSEAENFSSVFTQSLTSLYSQDAEANFEDKNYKAAADASVNESELNNCARPKQEDFSNGCNTEYSFNSVFSNDLGDRPQHSAGVNAFENLKIKSEFPEIESPMRYDNYSMDDSYLKRRGSLADAYNCKRKRSSVPSLSYRTTMDDGADPKTSGMFNSQSQWIPNSIQGCHGNETSSNDTYQTPDYPSGNPSGNYDGFDNSRGFKRQPTKSRGSRGRQVGSETRVQNAIKRIPKKISPLTVYAKIHDDRIIEVTCRRYKKRTKPANVDDTAPGQNVHETNSTRSAETMEKLYQSVQKVVRKMVDKVSATAIPKRSIDLSLISPAKAKELLSKLCVDYCLDDRDFQNFGDILQTNLTKESEDVGRAIKKRRTSEREETNIKESNEIHENNGKMELKPEQNPSTEPSCQMKAEKRTEKSVEIQNPPKTERKVGRPRKQHIINENERRVLRSLPSRQPCKKMGKKTKKMGRHVKNRYPKRKTARGGRAPRVKKLKILIDLSKDNSNTEEVLELDSESSRLTSNPGVEKDDDDDDDDDDGCAVDNDVCAVDNDDCVVDIDSSTIKEADKEKHETEDRPKSPQESPKAISHTQIDEEPQSPPEDAPVIEEDVKKEQEVSASDEDDQIISILPQPSPPTVKDVDETLKRLKKEVDEDDSMLRQPPQLVCMAPEDGNDDKLFLDASQGKGNNCSSRYPTEGRLSPMYLRANGLEEADAPSPPKLKRTSMSVKYNRNYSGESNSCDFMDNIDSDDPDGKLVIDLEAHDRQQEKPGQLATPSKDENGADDSQLSQQSTGLQFDAKPVDTDNKPDVEEMFKDDDVIVIQPTETKAPAPIEVIDLVVKQTPMKEDKHSLLKEKLLEKPILKKVEDQLIALEKSAIMSGIGKCQSKAEQDESILRTLLLESEAIAGTSAADGANTDMSNVIALAGQEATANFDFLKASGGKLNEMQTFPTDPPLGLHDAMKLLKYQSYREAYGNTSSPEGFDDSQKAFKDTSSSSLSGSQQQTDTKEAVAKDPQQLKEKIKKLKNEIVYLQLMAEQKEKEKIAIVCFKRYKEEILKRIYKAYAFSVQGHVRDWIFSRRENSGENRSPSETAASNTHKNHRNESSRISESGRAMVEVQNDVSSYPVPAPAHAATNHRPQSIHSPQSVPKNHHRNPPHQVAGEKVSPVERMVAKATENYGLDMRNLRDGLRTTPDETSLPGTILQKVLSANSSRNSSPDLHRSWSPERAHKKVAAAPKLVQPLVLKKTYGETYAPLDMIMSQKDSPHKNPDLYRNSPESSRSAKPFHGNDRSQIQSLLSEPVQLKGNCNPYRTWSIQAGGRISHDRTKHPKPMSSVLRQSPNMSPQTNAVNVESPLQRQLNSHKAVSRPSFAMPSSLEPSNYSQHSTPNPQERHQERDAPIIAERMHEKKSDEDRRHHAYRSSPLSSNSTMPYGGHIIRNNTTSPLSTALSSPKPNVPAVQGSSASNNSTSSSGSGSNSTPLCMGCGVSDAKFLCSGCRKHWYCSPQCQSLRWPEHSRVCAGRMFSQSASAYS